MTGAARLPLDATGTASLLRVARESSAYYDAELEPIRGEVFGRSRAFDVRVARRGVTVRARPEITFADPRASRRHAARRQRPARLVRGLHRICACASAASPCATRTDGCASASWSSPWIPRWRSRRRARSCIAGDGRVVGRWFAKDASERPLLGAMAAAPGTYRLRVAAIDSGRPPRRGGRGLEAGLTPVGPFSLGSLMLGVSREGTTAPQLEFGSEPTAIA